MPETKVAGDTPSEQRTGRFHDFARDRASPSSTLKASRARLKERLTLFWNSQDVYWSFLTEEMAVDSPYRAKAASMIPDGSRVLDVACGRAANCARLLSRTRYFGSDISQKGLSHVQRPDLRLACADAEALPFADLSFDAVLSTYALEHSVNPVAMLSEMVRVVRSGGRIVLLGPTWDLPFWYPNSLLSRARRPMWRVIYTAKRLAAQVFALFGGPLPVHIVEEPDALSHPFVYDSDAVYVVWSYEVIRIMKRCGCRLVSVAADNPLLGRNPVVRALKRLLMLLPAYRNAGSTTLFVFEKH